MHACTNDDGGGERLAGGEALSQRTTLLYIRTCYCWNYAVRYIFGGLSR